MKIIDILKQLGWKEHKAKPYSYAGTYWAHPTKNLKFYIREKELHKGSKMLLKFSTSSKQEEVQLDVVNNLMIVGDELAIHLG